MYTHPQVSVGQERGPMGLQLSGFRGTEGSYFEILGYGFMLFFVLLDDGEAGIAKSV
jgi:hypothetical protein